MKKYIVTDPCYILTDAESEAVWSNFCDLWFDNKTEEAEKLISDTVGTKVQIEDTGYGDWANTISGPGVKWSDFYADAGLVCVCELTEKIEKTLMEKYNDITGAVFECEELKNVEFDRSDPNWTVVFIETDQGMIESQLPDSDYDSEGDSDYLSEDDSDDF